MKVLVHYRLHVQQLDLAAYLVPDAESEGGMLENAKAQSDLNAKAIGALAAMLVERGVLPFGEVCQAVGKYREAELLKGNDHD